MSYRLAEHFDQGQRRVGRNGVVAFGLGMTERCGPRSLPSLRHADLGLRDRTGSTRVFSSLLCLCRKWLFLSALHVRLLFFVCVAGPLFFLACFFYAVQTLL